MKTALVTGATSALGMALAHSLSTNCQLLIITGRSLEKLEILQKQLKKRVEIVSLSCDLSQKKERKILLEAIAQYLPDLIINNAGLGLYGPALNYPIDEQMDILEVNAKALLEITLFSAQTLLKQQKTGIVLNIASVAGFFSFPTFSVYSGSKSFVINVSAGLDREVKRYGIRILCSCPGQIRTGFRSKAAKGFPQRESFLLSMSIQTAVDHILWQIKTKKSLYIFDWRYRIGVMILHLLPKPLREWLFIQTLSRRYFVGKG